MLALLATEAYSHRPSSVSCRKRDLKHRICSRTGYFEHGSSDSETRGIIRRRITTEKQKKSKKIMFYDESLNWSYYPRAAAKDETAQSKVK